MAGTCDVEGCDEPLVGRGKCHKHWQAWRRSAPEGEVRTHAKAGATPIERAQVHSVERDGHWVWHGSTLGNQPRIAYTKEYGTSALRPILLTITRGRGEGDYAAVPTCGEPMCVNPEHLDWITREDAGRRGAHAATPQTKVSDERLREAITWHRDEHVPVTKVAERLGLSRSAVTRRWREQFGYVASEHAVHRRRTP